ncbi:MAG: hypothetical protein ACOYVD_11535 [Bacillota bacterium]
MNIVNKMVKGISKLTTTSQEKLGSTFGRPQFNFKNHSGLNRIIWLTIGRKLEQKLEY